RLHQVVLARKRTRLAVAAKQYLDSLEHLGKTGAGVLDPIVIEIGRDYFGTKDLVQNVFLKRGIVWRQIKVVCAALVRQQFRREVFQDVQRKLDRVAHVQVFVITAVPSRGLPFAFDYSAHIDIAIREQLEILRLVIRADHRDDADRGKKSGRYRKIAGAAAQDFLDFSSGSFDRVVG